MKALTVAAVFAAGVFAGLLLAPGGAVESVSAPVVTVVRDTVVIERPQLVRSVEVRTVEIPFAVGPDTVEVPLPIEQRQYRGEDYTAWVSGWSPRLDSIEIRRTVAQSSVVTTVAPVRSGNLSLGLQAGVGLTPKGVQPYVGVGVCWRVRL